MVVLFKKIANSEFWKTGALEFYTIFVMMILMPVYYWYLTPLMILWGLIWFLKIREKISAVHNEQPLQKLLFFSFIMFFIWQLIGMFYSDDLSDGLRNITLRLPLLLFPLVLISPGEKIKQNIRLLLHIFAAATFLFIIACFVYALIRSVNIGHIKLTFNPHPSDYPWLNYFYGSYFAIFQHPSYLSMFALLSAFIAFEFFFKKQGPTLYMYFWLLAGITLLASVYLLSSRAAILASIIIVPIYLIHKFIQGDLKKIGLIGLGVCIILIFAIFITNPRFKSLLKNESGKELIDKTRNEARISLWKSAFTIIRDNFLIGVGTGDIQNELNREYVRSGNDELTKVENLNTHNQFLEIAAENGIIGLVLFLAIFATMVLISIKEKRTLYFVFIAIIFFSFLFETMLNRLAGLSFFSLFSFLLSGFNQDQKE
jgi:O-antigen ligase